jgi:hypothetical protein
MFSSLELLTVRTFWTLLCSVLEGKYDESIVLCAVPDTFL